MSVLAGGKDDDEDQDDEGDEGNDDEDADGQDTTEAAMVLSSKFLCLL